MSLSTNVTIEQEVANCCQSNWKWFDGGIQAWIVQFSSISLWKQGLLRRANKPMLADAICILVHNEILVPQGNVQFVLDGRALLQGLPWSRGWTFESLYEVYTQHIQKSFGLDNTTVIFYGYPDRPSTKDYAHLRHSKCVTGAKMHFTEDMACNSKKQLFFSKKSNEQNFYQPVRNQASSQWKHCNSCWGRCWSAHCWNCSGVTVQPPHNCYSWWHRCIDSAHTLCTNFISGSVLAELQKRDFQEAWICFEHLTSTKGPWRRCLHAHSLRPRQIFGLDKAMTL